MRKEQFSMSTKMKVINNRLLAVNEARKLAIDEQKIIQLFKEEIPDVDKHWINIKDLKRSKKIEEIVMKLELFITEKKQETSFLKLFIQSNNEEVRAYLTKLNNIELLDCPQNAEIILLDVQSLKNNQVPVEIENKKCIFIEKNHFIVSNITDFDKARHLFSIETQPFNPFELLKALSLLKNEKLASENDHRVILINEKTVDNMLEYYYLDDRTACVQQEETAQNYEGNIEDKNVIYQRLREFQKKLGYWIQEVSFGIYNQVPYNIVEMKTSKGQKCFVGETPFEAFRNVFSIGIPQSMNGISSEFEKEFWCNGNDQEMIITAKTAILLNLLKEKGFISKEEKLNIGELQEYLVEEHFISKAIKKHINMLENLTVSIQFIEGFSLYQMILRKGNQEIHELHGVQLEKLSEEMCIYIIAMGIQNNLLTLKANTFVSGETCRNLTPYTIEMGTEKYLDQVIEKMNGEIKFQNWKYNYLLEGTGIFYTKYFWEEKK